MDQVAVFIDFENLVLGAEDTLPGRTNPVPYAALDLLCRDYGSAAIRRAYADWSKERFRRHQEDLAMNGVDLIQVARFGLQQKNAADIRMAVDAMEGLITHPAIGVYVLVAGDGDYSPLVQRLREFGKRVVGVGTEASASRRLVSVCSEYRYWGTLVAAVDPAAAAAVKAEFDIGAAEQLLVSALGESTYGWAFGAWLKSKMLALDSSFDERNYGCRSFREFLDRIPQVEVATTDSDIRVSLQGRAPAAGPSADGPGDAPLVVVPDSEPDLPSLLRTLRQRGMDLPLQPPTRDSLLTSVHEAWRLGRLSRVADISDVLLDEDTGHIPNARTRANLRIALVHPDTAVLPLSETPQPDVRPIGQCAVGHYDGSSSAAWCFKAHAAWLAWALSKLRDQAEIESRFLATFFADAEEYGRELLEEALPIFRRRYRASS
jgi:uncharacterized LabA/DUF88 family protein